MAGSKASKFPTSPDISWEPRTNCPSIHACSSRGQECIPPELLDGTLADQHGAHQGTIMVQGQARQTVYWPGIDADIANYVCWCTICTKHKASPHAQPMLSRDIPSGPWQEIAADYCTQKGREYLLVCDLISKYPFIYKVST